MSDDIVTEQSRQVVDRRAQLRDLQFSRQGGELMVPGDGLQLLEMARIMSKSDLMVRDFYRNNEGACAALIALCAPYKMNPFMVSWKTYRASKNADAPISFEAQLVNAMVNLSAPVKGRLAYAFDGTGANRTCTVTGIDRETGAAITYTSPPIGSISVKNSPLWKGDPDQQLGYYSARAWARRHFPELLLGVYARGEIEEAKDVTPKPGGGLAERVRAAAEAAGPPPVEDAEELPDEPVEAVDEPSDDDVLEGFPGTDAWDQGVAGAQAGVPWRKCPYAPEQQERADWLGGWRATRRGV